MKYKVLAKKGINYRPSQGGALKTWTQNSFIVNADIEKQLITIGGLERLEKDGKVELANETITKIISPFNKKQINRSVK